MATAEDVSGPALPARSYILAIASGLLIAFAGVAPWIALASLNASILPEWPWAAAAMLVYLLVLLSWLNGWGWPRSTRAFRHFHLRLWRPEPSAWRGANLRTVLGLMLAAAALYPLWIALAPDAAPDLSAYPTTSYRISILLMGAIVSGVVEEAAYRGYLQSQLERFGATPAIMIASLVFALSHLTNGLAALPLLPGFFFAGVLYGLLALRSGSLLPGMVIHSLGDAAYTYFGVLKGDASYLFAAP